MSCRFSPHSLIGALVLVSALCGMLVLSPLLPAPAAEAVDVIGDDETDSFVGSGSVILPASVDSEARRSAATCAGCRWRVTLPCQSSEEHHDAACRGETLGCPQGREIHRAWLARPGREFEPVGLYCPSHGEVTSVAEVTREIAGGFAHHVPGLNPQCQPGRGVVVGIPLHCRSGQGASVVRWSDEVAGMTVQTTARGSWSWGFREESGSRGELHTTSPGSAYPGPGVLHTFRTPGVHGITVVASWDGEFTVDGLGPFPVQQGLRQERQLRVPVSSALAVIRP